jgi:S-(hydroxymethyl)glutathione dehydrogenase / alcohol dehydrogenase
MKAAVCHEFGKPLVIEEVNIAEPVEGEVLVKLAATAVCHSDIHDMKGELPGPLPFIGGHESAGYVSKIGPGVTTVAIGDPVMVTLLSTCGQCQPCLNGWPHLCLAKFAPSQRVRLTDKQGKPIIQKGSVGGFAEYVLVGESQVVKMPKDMPLDRAALLACGVMTGFGAVTNRVKVPAMSSVVVIGTGGVGLNSIQAAALSGAYPVIAVDVIDSKLEAAKKFGATHGVNAKSADALEAIQKLTGGGADYVFVTVGSVAAIKQGVAMSGVRGTTVIVGIPPAQDTFTFSTFDFLLTEKTLTAGFMGSTNIKTDMPKLIALYKAGKLKLDELITNRYPLEKINEAMASTIKGEALRNVIMF